MQHAVLDFGGAALVPELGTDVAAGAACNVQLVLPQAQGMGIGTALLYASEAEAKRRGAESLELMVWSFNKSAMRFYESAGMTVRSFVMEKKL